MARSTMITINGSSVQLTDDQVFLATRSRKPEKIQTYAVLVNDTVWPPIQLITLATGVPGTAAGTTNYNSHTALKALNDLGFDTFERVEHDLGGNVVVRESRKRA
ncbi:hypothetical protein [Nocardia huaxiensis]|uniref:hypothetical protein n=1 Tax=Nocardia huaxiensis TaxID=2755382 RepID=UPI001E51C1AD|nr:hypothetical protein [Nocardia huaxiensis]UFS99593.1 hypothetical protein LPY97_17750 [Nocardia huaxiensis]